MATSPRLNRTVTLEEFLRMPGIEEPPGLEYIDGRIEAKGSPQKKHSVIQGKIYMALEQFAEPAGLGMAFMELRCTFARRSILPDVTFLLSKNIHYNDRGEYIDETPIPPDIHIEIISPDHRVGRSREKLIHSTANGCGLGVLIHPYRKRVEVYRPGVEPEALAPEGQIDSAPILPGLTLTVSEVFGWLTPRFRGPGADPV